MEKKDIKKKIKLVTGAAALSLFLTSCGNSDDVKMDTEDNKEVVTYLDENEYVSMFKTIRNKIGPNVSEITYDLESDLENYLYNVSAQANSVFSEAQQIYQERLEEDNNSKEELQNLVIEKILNNSDISFDLDYFGVYYNNDIITFKISDGPKELDYNSNEDKIHSSQDYEKYQLVVADPSLDNVSEFLFSKDSKDCDLRIISEDVKKVLSSNYLVKFENSSQEVYSQECDDYYNAYDIETVNNYIGVVYNEKNMENLQSSVITEGINTIKSSYVYDDKTFNDFRISKSSDGSWIISENDLLIGELTPEQSYLCNYIGALQGGQSSTVGEKFGLEKGVIKLMNDIDNYKILTNDDSLEHGNSR